jgi:hypothetical protein
MEGCIQEITQKLPSNVGVSFINKKAPVRRLFDPEAFHTGNYTKITQQCGCHFYKQKSPLKWGSYWMRLGILGLSGERLDSIILLF